MSLEEYSVEEEILLKLGIVDIKYDISKNLKFKYNEKVYSITHYTDPKTNKIKYDLYRIEKKKRILKYTY